MNMHEGWQKALESTEILRCRAKALKTFGDTKVPYIMLSKSLVSEEDTVVRRGEILVEKPSLILPPNTPQFEGFRLDEDYEGEEKAFLNFLLVRGIAFPSLKYNNKTYSLDMFDGRLAEAIKHYQNMLERREDVLTGLIACPGDCWQFSALIFVCSQISRNADTDIKNIMEEYRRRSEEN